MRPISEGPEIAENQPYVLAVDMKSPKNTPEEEFTKLISRKPDRTVYVAMGITWDYSDPEFQQPDLYSIDNSVSPWGMNVINDIKFMMPHVPPLYNWDKIPKVNNKFFRFLFFINKTSQKKAHGRILT
jgi:hypothetical protein